MPDPVPERPYFGTTYGIDPSNEGLLPWSWASEQLGASRNYWIGSTRPDGRPHAAPVWGVWMDGAVYFSSARDSRKARNLAKNPQVVVHLESGDEVVILEGIVAELRDAALYAKIASAYNAKYQGIFMAAEMSAGDLVYGVRPLNAYGWLEQ
ncbi:MAG TPA: pyridoxamine 5'-phosphate oxidase family protein, partial [Anaerolineales bacterium]|nr:pyridoxamine 5'-phosphate oxidase family protein [Anaerolineales bacterium]